MMCIGRGVGGGGVGTQVYVSNEEVSKDCS